MNDEITGFHFFNKSRMIGTFLTYIERRGDKYYESVGLEEDGRFIMKEWSEMEGLRGFLVIQNKHVLQDLYTKLGTHLSENRILPMDGQFSAMEKHLKDMRAIVFKKLGVDLDLLK